MRRLLTLCLLLPAVLAAADPDLSPRELMRLAIDRSEAAEAAPLESVAYFNETLSSIYDGDDLEEKERILVEVLQWSADSTETRTLEEEVIFTSEEPSKEKEPGEEEDGGGKREIRIGGRESEDDEENDRGFPDFDEGFRDRHEFRFEEWTLLEGREAGLYKVRPLKNKKQLYWKGRIWFDAATGALLAYDLEPAKRPFGMKAMKVHLSYLNFEGRDLPATMDFDLHIKVPLIVNKRVEVRSSFRDYRRIEKTGEP